MNYAEIKEYDIANGPGVRLSVFVSGCTHHCKGCFNPMTWDFSYGKPYTQETEDKIITLLGEECYQGLTLLGGEPMEPVNQKGLLPLLRQCSPPAACKSPAAFRLRRQAYRSGASGLMTAAIILTRMF